MSAPRSGGWTTKRTPTRVSVYLKDNSYLRSRLHPRGTTHVPLATHTQRAKKRVHVTTLPASLLSPPKDKTNRRTTAESRREHPVNHIYLLIVRLSSIYDHHDLFPSTQPHTVVSVHRGQVSSSTRPSLCPGHLTVLDGCKPFYIWTCRTISRIHIATCRIVGCALQSREA